MAEQRKAARKLEQDRIVEALVPDPAAGPPNTTVLHGFLGKSTQSGVWRLYLTEALDEYVEIPEDEILHTQQLPDDGGTLVWVPKTLALQHVSAQSQQVQADFLGGPITEAHLRGAAGPTAMPGITATAPISLRCPSDLVPCPSDFAPCRSFNTPCVSIPVIRCPGQSFPWWRCPSSPVRCVWTRPIACPPRVSVNIPCQTELTRCPSAAICPSVAGCPSELVCGGGFGGMGGEL